MGEVFNTLSEKWPEEREDRGIKESTLNEFYKPLVKHFEALILQISQEKEPAEEEEIMDEYGEYKDIYKRIMSVVKHDRDCTRGGQAHSQGEVVEVWEGDRRAGESEKGDRLREGKKK